jgi:uncharacterized protein (DUF58 family)
MNSYDTKAEGITWISPQSLIQLRLFANQIPLDSGKIHAKQGGAYLSSFKGRGMEFDESRIYQAGDDIRNMDWRVTARTGLAHTKVFREERERPILLWLDLNASMMFATRNKFKSVLACEIASLIAWSAATNNDRLGGLIFSAEEHIEIKPRRGKTAALDFIGRCTQHSSWSKYQVRASTKAVAETASKTISETEIRSNKTNAVSRLQYVTHPGSLIFMISDFRNMDDKTFSRIASLSRNNDIIMIKVSDPIEADLPVSGSYRLTDGIKELQLQTGNKKIRDKYHQRYVEHEHQLETFCRQNRIHLINASTNDDALTILKTGLGITEHSNRTQLRTARRKR